VCISGWPSEADAISVFGMLTKWTYITRLETRTKEERFRNMLMAFGDKFSPKEVDDAFEQFEIDDNGKIDSNEVIGMLTASAKKEEGEEQA
jgi:Ca2+-binding EF-hand superfamily protein